MESPRQPPVEGLEFCGARQRWRLVLLVLRLDHLPSLPGRLARPPLLVPTGPGHPFAGRRRAQQLDPRLQRPDHSLDGQQRPLLGVQRVPMSHLEGAQLRPQRFRLQLQLRHLVAKRLEQRGQLPQALAQG